ncbi:hypothetical protein JHK87_007866 [Glycine soja]|nr:hypothetical protein JHK87_007866 [Glycine soja]
MAPTSAPPTISTASSASLCPTAPFRNAANGKCASFVFTSVCDPSLVHMAITLDVEYLRGSIVAVHSILQHSQCPENIFFHFLVFETNLKSLVKSTFPQLNIKVYYFDPEIVRNLISTSVRQALEQSLNYARNYLADLLEPCIERVCTNKSYLVDLTMLSTEDAVEFEDDQGLLLLLLLSSKG